MCPVRIGCCLVLLLVAPMVAAQEGTSVAECSDWVIAWSSKVRGKAARQERIVSARTEALHDLARRAWSVAAYRDTTRRATRIRGGGDLAPVFVEDELVVETGRLVYRVIDRLHGGRYEQQGDRSFMEVRYCLSTSSFEAARRELLDERRRIVEGLRARFAELDRAVVDHQQDYAGRLFSALKGDVSSEVAGHEVYRSEISGEAHSFRAWLERWSVEVRSAHSYAAFCSHAAAELLDRGHLRGAELQVQEALLADRFHVRALQIRERIAELRAQRRMLLRRAESLAEVGAIAAAERRIAQAEAIGGDDRASLELARDRVTALKARFDDANPRLSLAVGYWREGIAVDGQSTVDHLLEGKGVELDIDPPAGWSLDLSGRVGRWGRLLAFAGFGSTSCGPRGGGQGACLRHRTLGLGAGLASPRGPNRPVSFGLFGGVAREAVEATEAIGFLGLTSEERTGGFIRVSLQSTHLGLYVQHGIGFEDDPQVVGAVIWSDGVQAGLTWSF